MDKEVYVFLAEGFEEIEAITTIDLLRRAGLTTITVAIGDSLEVQGANHIPVIADIPLASVNYDNAQALVLPGGLPGVTNLNASEGLKDLLKKAYEDKKVLGAICAAPMVYGQLGFLQGREATCYPNFEEHLKGYKPVAENQGVAIADNIITAKGAGCSVSFALALIEKLCDKQTAEDIAQGIIYLG